MYRVIKAFTDMQDNNFAYQVGDEFPKKNFSVLVSRIKEFEKRKNRQGVPLIEEIPEKVEETKKKKSVEKADEE